MLDLGFVALLTLIAAGVGLRVLRGFGSSPDPGSRPVRAWPIPLALVRRAGNRSPSPPRGEGFDGPTAHPLDALALALPLGFGGLALATLGLGEIGQLHRTSLAAVLLIGGIVAAVEWPRHLRAIL